MAIKRSKSVKDIRIQRARMMKELSSRVYNAKDKATRDRYIALRDKVAETAGRYEKNILKTKGNKSRANAINASWDRKDALSDSELVKRLDLYSAIENTRYSRNTYMGLNEG